MAQSHGIDTKLYVSLILVLALPLAAVASPAVFRSSKAFRQYVEGLKLVGRSVSDATKELQRQGFNCDPADKLPNSSPVVCGKSLRGLTVVEKLTVSIGRSANGEAVAKVTTGYMPISSP